MSNRLFDITGSTGASHTYHLHPIQRVLAYESGCYIILWDLDIDKKLMIHPHDYTVTCVKFFGRDYEYLLSIDGNYRPSIFITEWQTMTRIHQVYLPVSRNSQKVASFEVTYCQRTNMLIIVANYGDHYSFSVWDFRLDNLALIATNKEDNQETCVGVHTFDDESDTFFAIAERNVTKYWRYYNRKLELVHKIHSKEEIVSTAASNLTQLFLFATKQGRVCVVSKEGQFIGSIKHPSRTYTSLTLFSDYLFLGSKEGEIDVYQLSTLQFSRPLENISQAVKAQRNIHKPENKNLTTQKLRKDPQDLSEEKLSNKLVKISVAKSTGLLALKYADNNIFIYDMDTERVLYSVTGHSKKINNVFWNTSSKSSFVTCSNDGTIRVWNFIGDRWESYPLTNSVPTQATFPVAVMQDQSFQSDEISFNTLPTSYKVTCMQVDWLNKEIFTGDNHGCLNIYDLSSGYLKYSLKVSGFKLREISVGESFVGMAFSNQSCLIVERQGSYEAYMKLEEPRLEMGSKQKEFTGIKLLENENHVKSPRFFQGSRYDTGNLGGRFKGFESTTSSSTSQRAITVHNANSLRLHQIVANQGKLESAILTTYHIQGRIVDYMMHVSNDYLLVLSNEDLLYIFEVNSGEIKGKIEMPRFSKKITCDPAGLYITVASPLISPESEDVNYSDKPYLTMGSTKGFSPTKDKDRNRNVNTDQSILSVFELWTGEYVGLMSRIQTASYLSYSYDGSYLAVGTSQGLVTVLSLDEGLRENIYAALEGIRQNPVFWTDFKLDMGEKKLSSDAFATLRPGESFNASRASDIKFGTSLHGSSPSKVRSPQLNTQSLQNFKAQPVQPYQMKSPPSGKAPTMKDSVQNNKVQKNSIQQKKKNQAQEEQSTVMLIAGYDQTRTVTNNPSTVSSKIMLPDAALRAHQEKAKEHAEHIRAVNFGRRDSEDDRKNQVGKKLETPLFRGSQQQQFIPRSTGPIDKVIDLVVDGREFEGFSRVQVGGDNRKMHSDPSDIDEKSFLESYDRRGREDNRRVSFFDNPTVSSRNAVEDVSNMYEDINEFERKFYRDSNPNWH